MLPGVDCFCSLEKRTTLCLGFDRLVVCFQNKGAMNSLIQLRHPQRGRHVALVDGEQLYLLDQYRSVYELAWAAVTTGEKLGEAIARERTDEVIAYEPLYSGDSEWSILPAMDHPTEPSRCRVSGTGLTHVASAKNRDAMHVQDAKQVDEPVTDSMQMFQWGVAGGKPAPEIIGVQPEWFYKGDGSILRGHGQPLEVPAFADDGGEEPEIAGVYLIDGNGQPWRIGMAAGNEFADHVMERKNYLYLAPSKLRVGSIGPQLIVDGPFDDVAGQVRVERGGVVVWRQSITTGEKNMSHSIANLEHHHFKYPQHRQPGDVHIHFYGADAFSFGAGITLEHGDEMVVEWQGFGRPLRNPIYVASEQEGLVKIRTL